MILEGERVRLRPATEADLDILTAILQEPGVAEWWGAWDRERVRKDFLEDEDDIEVFVIELQGEAVGGIEVWQEPDPEYLHGGIDLFLTADRQDQGLGGDAIRAAIRHLIEDKGHHRVTIDPAADNARAIRAYEKVGFRPVGRMRQYQLMPDGRWIDGLLMELLADEYVTGAPPAASEGPA